MRSFTVAQRRARLARRHFLAEPAPSCEAVTGQLLGLHATDPATPHLSAWARVPGFTVDQLTDALYEQRTLVKHLAMRRTLWVISVEDLPMIQSAGSDRVAANERRRLVADVVKAGISGDGDVWLDAACAAVTAHLAAAGPTTAKDLRAALPELAGHYDPAPGKRWGGQTPLAPRVLTVLAVRGDIVRGPNEGSWTVSRPRWASMAEWLPSTPVPVEPDSARTAAVERWLRAFGPATVTDVKWWFGNTLTWARQALRDLEAEEVDLDGAIGYVLPDDVADDDAATASWCALLPGLDVTTMGWFDRDWYLGEHRNHVFDRNGNGGPTVWCDGRIVGAWGQDSDGRVQLRMLESVGRTAQKALDRRARDLTEWLADVRVLPRFPSPVLKG